MIESEVLKGVLLETTSLCCYRFRCLRQRFLLQILVVIDLETFWRPTGGVSGVPTALGNHAKTGVNKRVQFPESRQAPAAIVWDD